MTNDEFMDAIIASIEEQNRKRIYEAARQQQALLDAMDPGWQHRKHKRKKRKTQ